MIDHSLNCTINIYQYATHGKCELFVTLTSGTHFWQKNYTFSYEVLSNVSIWLTLFSYFFQTASSSGDPHVHIIKQVKPTDEGLYTCIAGNVLGQATASAYLEVNRAGSHLSFSCYTTSALFLLVLLVAQNPLFWIHDFRLRPRDLQVLEAT